MESWVTQALPGAVAYASSLLGNRGQGEDIVQDCVCRLLTNAARYDLPRDGRKLLFRSISNACINLRIRERESFSLDDLGRVSEDAAWELEDKTAMTPIDQVIGKELRVVVTAGLQTLPLRQRSVIELSSMGYRPMEIAEMVQMPPEHVRVLLSRARKALSAFLQASSLGGVTP